MSLAFAWDRSTLTCVLACVCVKRRSFLLYAIFPLAAFAVYCTRILRRFDYICVTTVDRTCPVHVRKLYQLRLLPAAGRTPSPLATNSTGALLRICPVRPNLPHASTSVSTWFYAAHLFDVGTAAIIVRE